MKIYIALTNGKLKRSMSLLLLTRRAQKGYKCQCFWNGPDYSIRECITYLFNLLSRRFISKPSLNLIEQTQSQAIFGSIHSLLKEAGFDVLMCCKLLVTSCESTCRLR